MLPKIEVKTCSTSLFLSPAFITALTIWAEADPEFAAGSAAVTDAVVEAVAPSFFVAEEDAGASTVWTAMVAVIGSVMCE